MQIMLAWVGRPTVVRLLEDKDMRSVYCLPVPKKVDEGEKKLIACCVKVCARGCTLPCLFNRVAS